MGKGSGTCQRPGITLEASGAETELYLSGDVASVSDEINTTLELHTFEGRWFTKDYLVTFERRKEGWTVFTFSDPIYKACREYGVISTIKGEHSYFPSLKAARQSVNDVSLEAGLNIDSGLARGKFCSYEIGDLPLSIGKANNRWRVYAISAPLHQSLQDHFNSVEEFRAAWESTDSAFAHYPTRKAAHQAALNWLAQTITKSNSQ
jgi:hypothetical protein